MSFTPDSIPPLTISQQQLHSIMKRVKCCTACRRRHRKCVTQPGASQCGTCLESGQECRFENDIRFKHTHSEGQKESGRKWAKVPQKISFTTPRGIDGKVPEESDTRPEVNESMTQPISEGMMEISIDDTIQPQTEEVFSYWESPSNLIADTPIDQNMTPAYQADHTESSSLPRASIPFILDPQSSSPHGTGQGLTGHGQSQDPFELTEREAYLFMTYIHKLAPLSDACDDARHFALEVPRLALHQPMIMNGLLALASRYDSRCTNTSSDIESTFYHNKCIKLLIEAFAQPPETWDSTLLTAVVIARLYEENDNETDSYYHHLSGTQNLLNHEVIAREPLEICLENFERSTVFRRSDDSAYANRAVYNFARLMRLFLPMESLVVDFGEWGAAEGEIEEWYDARPVSFKPIFHKAADISSDRPFPVICFAASVPGELPFTSTVRFANMLEWWRCSITTQPRPFCACATANRR
ncbi:transcription regulatory SNF2 [Fusarium pseudoanthophilum]|uniref:Transcription regulatory SNF2 n=1 Tax=Fusarium pseudoanthophilum TaxID=48495 RepID=A0A8H5KLX9_9HYPO|nr:transcription regulatory SNF2 [Fusarium pseudoanthophilum]